jgi:hypothetical protein
VGVSCVARLNIEIERLCMLQDDSREMTSRVVYTDMCLSMICYSAGHIERFQLTWPMRSWSSSS